MRPASFFKSSVVRIAAGGVLLAAVLFFLVAKDRFFLDWTARQVRRLAPDAQFSVERLTVWPHSVCVRDVRFFQPPRPGRPAHEILVPQACVRLSPFFLLWDPLLSLRSSDAHFKAIQWDQWLLKDLRVSFQKHPRWPFVTFDLEAGSLRYQKKALQKLRVSAWVQNKRLLLNDARIEAFGGTIRFHGVAQTPDGPFRVHSFALIVEFHKIDIGELLSFMGGGRDLEVGGIFDGVVTLEWVDGELQVLRGHLDSAGGGLFVVKDPSLLGAGAGRGGAETIVIENLKNYHYDIGKIGLRNLGQDIRMDIVLQGESGRRDVELVWHHAGKNDGGDND